MMRLNSLALTRRQQLALLIAAAGVRACPVFAAEPDSIAPQPYFEAVNRALTVLGKLGAPLAVADARQIAALSRQNDSAAVDAAEKILDRHSLARINIEKDSPSAKCSFAVAVITIRSSSLQAEQEARQPLSNTSRYKGLTTQVCATHDAESPLR